MAIELTMRNRNGKVVGELDSNGTLRIDESLKRKKTTEDINKDERNDKGNDSIGTTRDY